ncbi:tetratricopeptide repeat protein [bacterium D16-51]|nr:tetratricopeptide repeat protein [bacterium D16-59]RKI59607.1 tetratricopeptide repeat protein [bacterium D16-51]
MLESNQEGYRTLGWIINKSEQGLYIVVADEMIQKEIVGIYRQGAVGIYDCKRHPGEYSFRDLQEWVTGMPKIQIFMIVNFHLAIQEEESLKRLNFSRDMIEGLGKNFIFLVTPYGDDRLAAGAYDFYSFIKLRVIFHKYEKEHKKEGKLLSEIDRQGKEKKWEAGELRQKLAEAYALTEQAKNEKNKAHYFESEKLLLKAWEIKGNVLGTEHLEIAEINYELAAVYEKQGKYQEAEELSKKGLKIRENVLGEGHPDTAASYAGLAAVYEHQGKYREAEELYKKSSQIRKNVLGEEHLDTAVSYNNLAGLYEKQGKYEMALNYYLKAYEVFASRLGRNHPDTKTVYKKLKLTYLEYTPEGDFEQWMENPKNGG